MIIKQLTEPEKSVLLARAWGLKITVGASGLVWIDDPETGEQLLRISDVDGDRGFYNPAQMALAFKCHLWKLHIHSPGWEYLHWWKETRPWTEENAQELWLDKILELVIEVESAAEEER